MANRIVPSKNGKKIKTVKKQQAGERRTPTPVSAVAAPRNETEGRGKEVLAEWLLTRYGHGVRNAALVIEWEKDEPVYILPLLNDVPGFIPNVDLPWSGSSSEFAYPPAPRPGEE